MGICKSLISYIFKRLKQLGIYNVVLQTEQGYHPEKIYKNMGFKEIFKAIKYTEE